MARTMQPVSGQARPRHRITLSRTVLHYLYAAGEVGDEQHQQPAARASAGQPEALLFGAWPGHHCRTSDSDSVRWLRSE